MNLKKIFIVLLLILVTTGCDFSLGEDPSGSSSSLISNDFSNDVTEPVELPKE